MRTTIDLDDALLSAARNLTGITQTSSLVRLALERLVQTETARRLALLGGSDRQAAAPPRRRGEDI